MAFPFRIAREAPLVGGTLLKRYKRFLADIRLDDGNVVVAHCVNTGAMEGLTRPGTRVWASESDNPKRKLRYTWQLAEIDGAIVGVDTSLPNRIVGKLLAAGELPWLGAFDECVAERKYGDNRRIDFWLRKGERETFVEVKNCHLIYPDACAYFPDTVSERAAHHLRELAKVAQAGHGAEVLFFCQIPGVQLVRPSDAHDPAFASAAREVAAAGVRFSAIALEQTPEEIVVKGRVPVDLEPYATERMEAWRRENRAARDLPR